LSRYPTNWLNALSAKYDSHMEHHPLQRRDAILLLGAIALAWGTTWPVTKAILQYMPPLWTTATRSTIASLALFAISAGRRHIVLPRRGDVPIIANIVLLHMVAFSCLVAIGMQFVPAGRSVVLAYTTPLWVTIGARLFLAEPLSQWQAIGTAIGLCGLLLLFNPISFEWNNSNALMGNGLVLLAAFCWAASIVHVRTHRWVSTPFELVPWQVLFATCILVILALVFEGRPHVTWNLNLVMLLIYGGIVGIAVPYWATVTVARSLPAVTTSVGLLGVPVVGVLCSSIALGETLTVALVVAMGLIVAGIAIGTRR
jgi:drug/metabolite transporter (DMT)-like permease